MFVEETMLYGVINNTAYLDENHNQNFLTSSVYITRHLIGLLVQTIKKD